MEKTAEYYFNKVALLYFDTLHSFEKMQVAEDLLSKDEFLHLKELIEEKEK